ncbi:hypothetical protein BEP19_03120 [Ammoniphilus oxalaticus]|uniref:Copper amine oxidase-like N-terminal domain-containing protein n=1 Tax=Ammoniphilus oxalaticus TaxID=66863 RepID=A0A419SNV9_9BACL|nr:copper amine oxidase N-terminal domain-containing protein [Ammoniphilus oxalaticus]RKD25932.1 hypothetical protein BEP19_03120 [Ammoniphilus oxalaticus]
MQITKRMKLTSVMSTVALLASLMTPLVVDAAATVSVVGAQAVSMSATSDDYKSLGQLKIEVPITDIKTGDFFIVRLPADFKLNIPAATDDTVDIAAATITMPDGTTARLMQTVSPSDPWNDEVSEHLAVYQTHSNEMKVVVKNADKAPNGGSDANTIIKINLGSVYVPGSSAGKIEAIIETQPGSAFTNEKVTLATKGTGIVDVSVDSVKTIPESGEAALDTIRFKEDSPGALTTGSRLKLTLPSGFEWKENEYPLHFIYGDNDAVAKLSATRGADRRELEIQVPVTTNAASYFTLKDAVITVGDDKLAAYGAISVELSGTSKMSEKSLVVGKYVKYEATIRVGEVKNVLAGRAGAADPEHTEIGQLVIEEQAPGSLRAGGSIRVRLDNRVKWAVDSDRKLVQAPRLNTFLSDLQGLELAEWELVDDQTILTSVKTTSQGTKGGKLVLEKGLVDVAADATSADVSATISGNAGASGNAGVIANVVAPLRLSVPDATLKPVQAGVQDRTISDLIVEEQLAGAIDSAGRDSFIRLTFPAGVRPNMPDSDQIQIDGDLALDTANPIIDKDEYGRWYLQLATLAASSKPSTITFSGLKVTADRTVAEGEMRIELGGSMIQTGGAITNSFPQTDTVGSIGVANVVVPTNGTIMNSVSFVIGSNSYMVNDVAKKIDVAPFIDKHGRTLVPVRAVAEAFDAVVGWDPQDGKVTILKGGKAISVIVGSYVMNVNGVFIQNDSPAINKNGRVFLPVRVIAEAFGAKVNWDPQTETIYLN